MRLKLLLKRGGLLAAANWPAVTIQFAAQTTFQMLLAVPVVGAAVLVGAFLGGDLGSLIEGSVREMFERVLAALISEPLALVAFVISFLIALVGGSVLMFLVKGGTVDVMIEADRTAGPIEDEAPHLGMLRAASVFTAARYVHGCERLFRRYVKLGLALMAAYVLSGAGYLAFVVYGLRSADGAGLIGWALVAASSLAALVGITALNLLYLLLQIAVAAGDRRPLEAFGDVVRFVRAEIAGIGGVAVVVLAMFVVATIASALAWSGVALVAFVPLVGLAVVPLQVAAWIVRGLVFEYIGMVSMGAYVTLYRRYRQRVTVAKAVSAVPPASVPST